MPLYEYECLKCGERFEQIQRFSDPLLKKHPECGGQLKKLLSAPAIQFKGSGWYVTDYARKSDGAAANDSDTKKEKKSETKTEAKSETKTEAKSSSEASKTSSSSDTSKKQT